MELFYIIVLFCIPMYFVCRWVMYRKKIGNAKRRWLTAFFATIVITPILLCGTILLILILIAYTPNKKFTPKRWEENPEKRYMLSKNIIDKGLLIDKTPDEVIGLLGDQEQYIIQNDSLYQITYSLGCKGTLMVINWYYLDIFIEDGRVVRVEQNRDSGDIEYRLEVKPDLY